MAARNRDGEPGSNGARWRGLRPAPEQGAVRRAVLGALVANVLGAPDDLPRLGTMQVERRVSRGGMGVVFKGREAATGRAVAIKLLARMGPKDRARFAREVATLRAFEHPHVVRYIAHGEAEDGTPYLAMEWLEGTDLASHVEQHGVLTVEHALQITRTVAFAMHAAHGQGVVHRDLKPSNLIVVDAEASGLKVIDFGVAQNVEDATDQEPSLTSTGMLVGTPSYMAPEQVRGASEPRSDVYGLGATLYHLLTGRPPFEGAHAGAILASLVSNTPPPIDTFRTDSPRGLQALVSKMLAKDARERPPDMRAVATMVDELLAQGMGPSVGLSYLERTSVGRGPPSQTLGNVVGRARELAWIDATLEECRAERCHALVVLTGEPGAGKTSLLRELARRVRARAAPLPMMSAMRAKEALQSPLAVVSELAASLVEGALAANREALQNALSELAVTPWPADARTSGDQVRLAWMDLIEVASRELCLIIVDDADDADLVSLRYLERAFRCAPPGAALCVVVAQHDGAQLASLRDAIDAERVFELRVGPLPNAAARQLAEGLAGPQLAPEQLDAMLRLSGRHPGRLYALAARRVPTERSSASTSSACDLRSASSSVACEPTGVEAGVLGTLTPDLRRVARAAAIVGEQVRLEALAALLDEAQTWIAEAVSALTTRGVLVAGPHEGEVRFANDVLLNAVLDLVTPDDRTRGHVAMARWIDATRPGSHLAVARHLEAAGLAEAARTRYLRAAYLALAGEQTSLVETCLARARGGSLDAEVDMLSAELALWRGDLMNAGQLAASARRRATQGEALWFHASSIAITASGQRGDHEHVRRIAESVVDTSPANVTAADARAVAIGRATTQLEMFAVSNATRDLVAHLPDERDVESPTARAWLARVQATRASHLSFDAIAPLVLAHRAHMQARDLRSALQVSLYLASYFVWSGAWEAAREHLDECRRVSARLGITYLETWTAYTEGKLLAESGASDAADLLADVHVRAAGSPRISGGALLYGALVALRSGNPERVCHLAEKARASSSGPSIVVPAVALLVLAHLAEGDTARACALAPALEVENLRLVEHDELVELARAELALACGPPEAAQAVLQGALTRIERRAASLDSLVRRNEYLARPPTVVRTGVLGRRWLSS